MISIIRILLILFLVGCNSSYCIELKFDHYFVNEGLPNAGINTMLEDKYGFLWIATPEGLCKYNGYNFTTYRFNQSDSTSLVHNKVLCMFIDKNDNLYIGTSFGLCKYNYEFNNFIRFDRIKSYATINKYITALASDSDGNLLIGNWDGLDCYNVKQNSFNQIFNPASKGTHELNWVHTIYLDSHQRLWLGMYSNGLFCRQQGSKSFISYMPYFQDKQHIPHQKVFSVIEDDKKQIYIGTWGGGVSKFNEATQSFEPVNNYPANANDKRHLQVRTLTCDPGYGMVCGSEAGIYFILNNNTSNIYNYNPDIPSSISNNIVSSIVFQHNRSMWVGTSNGLNRYNPHKFKFSSLTHEPNKANSIICNNINTICEDLFGNIWIGTTDGLDCYNPVGNVYKHFNTQNGLTSNFILKLKCDSKGNIWVGTIEGLNKIAAQTHIVTSYFPSPTNANLENRVNVINTINPDTMLISTSMGLKIFKTADNSFSNYWIDKKLSKKIGNHWFNDFEIVSNSFFWVRNGDSIIEVNIKNGSYKNVSPTFDKYFKNNGGLYFLKCCEDLDGNRWIATSAGLIEMTANNVEIKRYSLANGLQSNHIYSLEFESAENIWVSTDCGLSKINTRTQKVINYDFNEGLQKGYVQNASVRLKNGNLLFGGRNGISIITPDLLKDTSAKLVPSFLNLRIYNKEVAPGTINSCSKSVQFANKIELDYSQKVFSVEFAALNALIPEKVQYAYKLEPFDKNWIYCQHNRLAEYMNLPAGYYKLKIKASENSEVWYECAKPLLIVVYPPFWKTWWFKILIFVLILGTIMYRYANIKRLNKYLEEMVRVRTKEIKEQNIELAVQADHLHEANIILSEQKEEIISQTNKLEESNAELQRLNVAKDNIFKMLAHDLRNPMQNILVSAEFVLNKYDVFQDDKRIKYISIIKDSAQRTSLLLSDLLEWAKSQMKNEIAVMAGFDLHLLVNDIVSLLKPLADQKNITFTISMPESLHVHSDINMIGAVLRNILTNAIKFSYENSAIIIAIKASTNNVEIEISDSGVGMPDKVKEMIFNMGNSYTEPGTKGEAGTGLGLLICKEYIEKLSGTIGVESVQGKGSTFKIVLPNTNRVNDYKIKPESDIVSNPQSKAIKIVKNDDVKSILVVDDNNVIRQNIIELLQPEYIIYEAGNGLEAFEKAVQFLPNIIISDIMMPEMNGYELCQKVKSDSRTSHISVILLTALNATDNEIKGLTAGADDYIAKPFNSEALLLRISKQLKIREDIISKYKKDLNLDFKEITKSDIDRELLEKASQLVKNNISNHDLGVELFVKELNISRTLLYEKFKVITGQTINEFILTTRLKEAVLLFRNTNKTVSEISYDCGFNDPSYFAKVFKKHFGTSPSEFKSQY